MYWLVSLFAWLILIVSVLGGMKEGAVKHFFNLVVTFIAIPLAGLSYHILTNLLSFLPGESFEGFFGFFITFAIISVILHLILLLPRKLIGKLWNKGFVFRIAGGALNLFNAMIGLALSAIVLLTYPWWRWLETAVSGSSILNWLANNLSFVPAMLPEIFRSAISVVAGLG